MIKTVLAILCLLAGTGAFLVFEVLCMAGSANSKPKDLAIVKSVMWGMLGCWVLALGVGGWALVTGRAWLAAGMGLMPVVVAIVLVVIAWVTEF